MPHTARITLDDLRRFRAEQQPFAMLTAYDHWMAAAAEAAGIHTLLVGDSLGTVVLGHANTRAVPIDLIITLAEAVRRGAPNVFLVGDMPFTAMAGGDDAVLETARRFRDEAGCDAIKLEVESQHAALVGRLHAAGFVTIAHLGLRPQSVITPDGYRAQAREPDAIAALVADCRAMVAAGAALLLLEAVPAEASAAVVAAVDVPVIGCGAGPACHGHVVVTHDMLGIGTIRPPKFVPVLADIGPRVEQAMRRWREDIATRAYPAPEHVYPMRGAAKSTQASTTP